MKERFIWWRVFTISNLAAFALGFYFYCASELFAQGELPAADFQIKRLQIDDEHNGRKIVIFKCGIMAAEGKDFRYPSGADGKVLKLLAVDYNEVRIQDGQNVITISRDPSVKLESEPDTQPHVDYSIPLTRPAEMDKPLVTVKPVEMTAVILGTNGTAEPKVEGLSWEINDRMTTVHFRLQVEDGEIIKQMPNHVFPIMQDDRGTKLASKPRFGEPDMAVDAYISRWKVVNPNTWLIDVSVNKPAYSSANKVKLEGFIEIWHGLTRQKGALPLFSVAKGTKLEFGGNELLITEVNGSYVKMMTVVPQKSLRQPLLKKEFYDENGKEILFMGAGAGSRSDSRTQLKESYMILRFDRPISKMSMKFETWDSPIPRKIPINLEVVKNKSASE